MSDTFQSGNARTPERRYSPRQRVPFACIQLDSDNGGLILDISERGLSVQAVEILTGDELPRVRFQLSPTLPWIETRGRIAWLGASMKRAGLEFTGIPEEARNQIKQWISSELHANELVEETTLERIEPSKDGPGNVIPFPEPETMGSVAEYQNLHSIADDAVEAPPGVEKVPQYSRVQSTTLSVTENARATAAPLFAWSELEARVNREINARERTSFPGLSSRVIGFTVGAILLLSAVFFLGYQLQKNRRSQPRVEAVAPAKAPGSSTDSTANPANSRVDPTPPSDHPGFMLQTGAMTHKENADALAEALQRRNFPAFVFRPEADRFYRVDVGPYTDADSALRAQEELKKEGFESIRTPWKP